MKEILGEQMSDNREVEVAKARFLLKPSSRLSIVRHLFPVCSWQSSHLYTQLTAAKISDCRKYNDVINHANAVPSTKYSVTNKFFGLFEEMSLLSAKLMKTGGRWRRS